MRIILLLAMLLLVACGEHSSGADDGDVSTDLLRYFPTQPGTVMHFRSVNLKTQVEGTTTITLEPQRNWCGMPVIPWRFTKSTPDVYWGPGLDQDLLWMVVAPDYLYAQAPAFNTYLWAVGHMQLDRTTQQMVNRWVYRSRSPYPPYMLGVKHAKPPIEVRDEDGLDYRINLPASACPQPQAPEDNVGIPGGWWLRQRIVHAVIPPYLDDLAYDGPALQLDYVEAGAGPMEQAAWGVREQWTFLEGQGLLKIERKTFGEALDLPLTPSELTKDTMHDVDTVSIRQRRDAP